MSERSFMKIKRTWTAKSLRAGTEEMINETKAREICGQTALGFHPEGACSTKACFYCPEPAMKRLLAGAKLEQFFRTLELVEA